MSRGVLRADRSPLSEEIKGELARIHPTACDARVLAALLPRATHLGVPARRLAHSTETKMPSSLRRACCRRAYLRGLFLAGGSVSAGPSGYLLELRPPRGEAIRAHARARGRGPPADSAYASWPQRVHAAVGRLDRDVPAARRRDGDAPAVRVTPRVARGAGADERGGERGGRECRARRDRSARAIDAVRALAEAGRLGRLSPDLRAAARARQRAPEASLAQLGARLSTTKWVVRQRMRRLVDEAAR